MKLYIGYGKNPKKGYFIDKKKRHNFIIDLEKFPYPFKKNSADEIIIINAIEHTANILGMFKELHRISKPNAIIKIRAPHFSCCTAFDNITHKRFFTKNCLDVLDHNIMKDEYYIKEKFLVIKKELIISNKHRNIFALINRFINKFFWFSEKFLCKWIPIDIIEYELKVIKD